MALVSTGGISFFTVTTFTDPASQCVCVCVCVCELSMDLYSTRDLSCKDLFAQCYSSNVGGGYCDDVYSRGQRLRQKWTFWFLALVCHFFLNTQCARQGVAGWVWSGVLTECMYVFLFVVGVAQVVFQLLCV